jgi:hypothetical protein
MKQLRSFLMGSAVMMMAAFSATAASAQTAPTFTRDVAPIFQEKCEA